MLQVCCGTRNKEMMFDQTDAGQGMAMADDSAGHCRYEARASPETGADMGDGTNRQ